MSTSGPPIASCPHCGTILLWTPEALVHPMPGERQHIRALLGPSWFAHAATPFDGRFHQCLGSMRQAILSRARGEPTPQRRPA